MQIELSLYDIRKSASGTLVTCDQPFCSAAYDGQLEGCEPNVLCQYSVTYGDGSTTTGYYVKDSLQYNQASGDLQTTTANASVIFGWVLFLFTYYMNNIMIIMHQCRHKEHGHLQVPSSTVNYVEE